MASDERMFPAIATARRSRDQIKSSKRLPVDLIWAGSLCNSLQFRLWLLHAATMCWECTKCSRRQILKAFLKKLGASETLLLLCCVVIQS